MKLFGIGFHKTGTTTLGKALEELGYLVCGPSREFEVDLQKGDLSGIYRKALEFDAFQDNPWPVYYKELDEKFPHSKFILTLRDEEKWIDSVVRHFGDQDTIMREIIYGVGHPLNNEGVYVERYREHNKAVIKYFKNRPDDLLVVSWEKGDAWEELCRFLNKDIPQKQFPHENRAARSSEGNSRSFFARWLGR